jgi:hypothetical protein
VTLNTLVLELFHVSLEEIAFIGEVLSSSATGMLRLLPFFRYMVLTGVLIEVTFFAERIVIDDVTPPLKLERAVIVNVPSGPKKVTRPLLGSTLAIALFEEVQVTA